MAIAQQAHSRIPPSRALRERVWPGTAFARAFWEMQATSRWQVAAAAYGLSYLFEHSGGDYSILFVIGAGAVIISLAIDLVTALAVRRGR